MEDIGEDSPLLPRPGDKQGVSGSIQQTDVQRGFEISPATVYIPSTQQVIISQFLAHMSKGQVSLYHGTMSVVQHPVSVCQLCRLKVYYSRTAQ